MCRYFIDTISRFVYNFCMMALMVKESDLNRIDVPDDYEVLDATALGRRLGFKRDTVLAYLSRRNFRRIPRPNRLLAMGPIWYEKSVKGLPSNSLLRSLGSPCAGLLDGTPF